VHATRLRERGLAPLVEVGYLNYSEPPFAQAVAKLVAAGVTRILVTPYFLVPGKFVKVDLPQAVEAARAAHPSVEFVLAEAIGYDERLADALIDSAQHAFGPAAWRDDLQRASAHCRPNPACPLYGTPACPKQPVPPMSQPIEVPA
jgi:sirohydrochlorin cobaltochelatase